jgi:lipopolysaccharide export system protein LptC
MKRLISNRQLNIGMAVIATTILVVFLLSFSDTGTPPRFGQDTSQQASPEFFIIDTHTREYDSTGRLITTVHSERVQHIGNTDTAHLLNPHHTSFQTDRSQWKTTAKEGQMHLNGEQLNLSQQVLSINKKKNTQIKTTAMTIYPNKEIAESNQTVTITNQQGFTRAKGLKANLATGEIHLLSHVRGQYHAVSK